MLWRGYVAGIWVFGLGLEGWVVHTYRMMLCDVSIIDFGRLRLLLVTVL